MVRYTVTFRRCGPFLVAGDAARVYPDCGNRSHETLHYILYSALIGVWVETYSTMQGHLVGSTYMCCSPFVLFDHGGE
jgi:hypothetical protein